MRVVDHYRYDRLGHDAASVIGGDNKFWRNEATTGRRRVAVNSLGATGGVHAFNFVGDTLRDAIDPRTARAIGS